MNAGPSLVRLAAHHGIEPAYYDIHGGYHELSESTARRLLAALGVAAATDDEVAESLGAAVGQARVDPLPPVWVTGETGDAFVPLTLEQDRWDAEIVVDWWFEAGAGARVALDPRTLEHEAAPDGPRGPMRRYRLPVPPEAGLGYHRMEAEVRGERHATQVIVAPGRAHSPPRGEEGQRPWGVSIQLYALRSARGWGIGDFEDLRAAVALLADLGADFVGLGPLHALFPHEPSRASPYSPSSRRFLNPLYVAVDAVPELEACAAARAMIDGTEFRASLASANDRDLVDYDAVSALKWPVLELLFATFRERHLEPLTERGRVFRTFQHRGGDALARYAVFEALLESADTHPWTDPYRDTASRAVSDFAASHPERIEYFQYLQWIAADQLAAAQRTARERGMSIGLYRDLAVGSAGDGADAWLAPEVFVPGASVGAPPDDFALEGQVWGLPPWSPERLRERGYRDWIEVLRSNMSDAGAIRIDHVMGLLRQFWVPAGGAAGDGAYVRFPVDDLLSVLALESVRNRCVVIGEDLGTVPDEMRAALHRFGVLSYRVLYFEKHWHEDQRFRSPSEIAELALVTVSTHDLPTLAGWWTGRDLHIRRALGHLRDDAALAEQVRLREIDRRRLRDALAAQGLDLEVEADAVDEADRWRLSLAVHRYAARSPAAMMSVQIEDLLGELDQANVPGTVSEQPNWRRRLPLPIEDWPREDRLRVAGDAITSERAPAGA